MDIQEEGTPAFHWTQLALSTVLHPIELVPLLNSFLDLAEMRNATSDFVELKFKSHLFLALRGRVFPWRPQRRARQV